MTRRNKNYQNFNRNNRGGGSNNKGNNPHQQRSNARILPQDVENRQTETLNQTFSSSVLSYRRSDEIVFANAELDYQLKDLWKRYKIKGFLNQHQIRRFINSCLFTVDKKVDHDVNELTLELGNDNGLLQRIKEILKYEVSVDAGLQANVASFQRVTLPFFALLTRSAITSSTCVTSVHAIYYLIYNNLDSFILQKVIPMLEIIVQRKSIADKHTSQDELLKDDAISFIPTSIGQFFLVLIRFVNELLSRIKEASINESTFILAKNLENLKDLWKKSFNKSTNEQNDPLISNDKGREFFFEILDIEFDGMKKSLIRTQGKQSSYLEKNSSEPESSSQSYREKFKFINMKRNYDPPGNLSELGPRHDNDFEDFTKILIAPTKDEILCVREPFIPTFNIPGSLELYWTQNNAERLLDSQFRLLREDMLHPIKNGIIQFLSFMSDNQAVNQTKIREYYNDGGKFNHNGGGLYVYSNIKFENISVDRRCGFLLKVSFKQRHMRSSYDRRLYWRNSKKLMNGSLICLLLPPANDKSQKVNDQYSFFFGIVASRDESDLSKERAEIGIELIGDSVYPIAIKRIFQKKNTFHSSNFMVEPAGVFFEAYYHVLKTIQSTRPSTLPFVQYLTPPKEEDELMGLQAPVYAKAPDFYFDLSALLENKSKRLLLDVKDPNSYRNAINELKSSKLDDTQAEALVSSLCREIALIQGPPGTGKTFVGVELMKVLLSHENRTKGKFGPILAICFTNHALDQFLEHLLDNGFNKIVRLGGRTKSDKIKNYNLEELYHKTNFRRIPSRKLIETLEKIKVMVNKIQRKLAFGKKKSKNKDNSIFGQWLAGRDIDNAKGWIKEFIPNWEEPNGDRPIEELIKETNVWQMSMIERVRLFNFWTDDLHDYWLDLLYQYKNSYEIIAKQVDQIYIQNRHRILADCHVIGMTTSGAAKLQSLIRSVSPKIVICEEAGEVLEAHILCSLAPCTQHLILIGDHQQLRPQCATYDLSVESETGKQYGLDISLFERLVEGSNAMKLNKCQLTIQRRMRAIEISDLIRHTLYPDLVDYKDTFKYDKVKGALHNVYFIDHRYQEDKNFSEHVLQSHSNQYEVDMVVEMVKHFIKNGYTKRDDIAVLTPYLGQLMKLQDALSKSVMVIIDERDKQNIDDYKDGDDYFDENNVKVDTVKKNLNQQVTLRTVDNFQGEEAKIVIISLVRNSLDSKDYNQKETIGFLKINNRTNVLLSRAKHGMYLIGNSKLMSKKSPKMWKPVIDILKERDPPQVGFGFPIACCNHPEYVNIITEAHQIEKASPNGGCHLPCTHKLPCGHSCPLKCHSDNSRHFEMPCEKKCSRLHPGCEHPCNKLCRNDCGKCLFPIDNFELACGHIYENPRCYEARDLSLIRCRKSVKRILPNCGHEREHPCYKLCGDDCEKYILPIYGPKLPCGHSNLSLISCQKIVKRTLPNCGHEHEHPCYELCGNDCGKWCPFPIDDLELTCGHIYENPKCHEARNLSLIRCQKIVKRTLPNCGHEHEHRCYELCGDNCGKCLLPIDDFKLPCGHTYENPKCYEARDLSLIRCQKIVKRTLPNCGHEHKHRCYELCGDNCEKCLLPIDDFKLPCGHTYKNPKCYEARDLSLIRCRKSVNRVLPNCGHENSMMCKMVCKGNLPCGHYCEKICHVGKECGNCKQPCNLGCSHIKCKGNCDQPCKICWEKCDWYCEHQRNCESLCSLPCSRLPCDMKCGKKLKCGHSCNGVCGEVCPSEKYCIMCASSNIKKQEVDWNANNMIVLECGHVFTMKKMDEIMEIQKYYYKKSHQWKSTSSFTAEPEHLETCPDCRCPVKNNLYKFIYEKRFSPHINAFFHSLKKICMSKYGMTLEDKFGKFTVDEHGCNSTKNIENLQLIVQMIGGNSILKTDESFYAHMLFTSFEAQKTILNEINLVILMIIKITNNDNKNNDTNNWIQFGKRIFNSMKTIHQIIHQIMAKDLKEAEKNNLNFVSISLDLLEIEYTFNKFKFLGINNTDCYAFQLEKDEITKNLSDIINKISKISTSITNSKPINNHVTTKAEMFCKDIETYQKLINQKLFAKIENLDVILRQLFNETVTNILAVYHISKFKFVGIIGDEDKDENFDKELLAIGDNKLITERF
ncbi:4526_t:CDS:10 [Entrophospora sp. SA101]|nr:4526_t:CDS:10 [Entrophospora sp. SA101]